MLALIDASAYDSGTLICVIKQANCLSEEQKRDILFNKL